MPRDPQSASEVYSYLLLLQKLGYPLWFPKPSENLPEAYQENGVSIGDVGIITPDGSFDFLFNICRARDDPINSNGVPEGFHVPLVLPDADIEKDSSLYIEETHIAQSSDRKNGVHAEVTSTVPLAGGGGRLELSFSSNRAAVLALPSGASLLNTLTPEFFRSYAEGQAESWYKYATVTRRRSTNALYLVTGCVKCSSWGVASLSSSSRSASLALNFNAPNIAEGKVSFTCSWEARSPAHTRTGPATPSKVHNQCVFMRGYRITAGSGLKARILGKQVEVDTFDEIDADEFRSKSHGRKLWGSVSHSKKNRTSRDGGPPGESNTRKGANRTFEVESIPSSEIYHPSAAVNAYLLNKMPKADFAITHDDHWCAVIRDTDDGPLEDDELVRRIDDLYFTVATADTKVVTLSGRPGPPPTNLLSGGLQLAAGASDRQMPQKGPKTENLMLQNELGSIICIEAVEEEILQQINNINHLSREALFSSRGLARDEVFLRLNMALRKKYELVKYGDNLRAYCDAVSQMLDRLQAGVEALAFDSTPMASGKRKSPIPHAPPIYSPGEKDDGLGSEEREHV